MAPVPRRTRMDRVGIGESRKQQRSLLAARSAHLLNAVQVLRVGLVLEYQQAARLQCYCHAVRQIRGPCTPEVEGP